MSRSVRRLLVGLAVLAAIVVGFLLALPYLLSLDAVRARVLASLESSLHRKVEAGAIRVEILSGIGAGIAGLTIHNPPGWETPVLASIERLSVKVAFWPLLSKRVEIRRIVFEGATVTIERDASGKLNIADLLAPSPPTGPPAAASPAGTAAFVLSRLRIARGRFVFADRKVSPGKMVSTSIDDLSGEVTDVGPSSAARFRMSGRFLADGGRNVTLEGTLGPPVAGKGLGEAPLDGKFVAKKLVLARLGPYLGSANLDPGVFSLDARLAGAPLGLLKVDGDLALAPPASSAIPPLDGRLALTYDGAAGTLAVGKSPVSVAKLPLAVEGRIDGLKTTPRVDLAIATPGDVSIENVTGFPGLAGKLPPDVKLGGRVRLSASIRGPASDLATKASLDAAPFSAARAGEPLLATSSLRATLDARGKGPMNGRVTAASGLLQKLPFEDLVADWTYAAGVMTLSPSLRAFGGALRARVETDVAHPMRESRVAVDVQNVQAKALAESLTTTRNVVSGALTAKMSLASRGLSWAAVSKTASGTGHLSLADAELQSVALMPKVASTLAALGKVAGFQVPPGLESTRFQKVETSLRLESGRLLTPDLTLSGRDVAGTADGWIGLDRTLSYTGRIVLGPAIVRSLGNAGRYVADEQGRLPLPFEASGSIASPKVTIPDSVALDLGRRALARRLGGSTGKILGDVLEGGSGGDAKSDPLGVLQQLLKKPPTPTPTPKAR